MISRLRLSCIDIVFFSANVAGITDCINNWQLYETCSVPIHRFIVVSVASILLIRLCHFMGQQAITPRDHDLFEPTLDNQPQLNWSRIGRLIVLSYFLIFGMLPFFICWTWYGTALFFMLSQGQAICAGNEDENTGWPFLVFWLILSYTLISCYFSLLLFGLNAHQKSKQVRKSMVQLLRRLNKTDDAQEIFDNALQNVQEEVRKRQEAAMILQEYGIFIMLIGLNKQEFKQVKVINFEWTQGVEDSGSTRCTLCFNDFRGGDKLKEFQCGHWFHIKCLHLWTSFEATCPHCLQRYNPVVLTGLQEPFL